MESSSRADLLFNSCLSDIPKEESTTFSTVVICNGNMLARGGECHRPTAERLGQREPVNNTGINVPKCQFAGQ
jgi:hypothetical protein